MKTNDFALRFTVAYFGLVICTQAFAGTYSSNGHASAATNTTWDTSGSTASGIYGFGNPGSSVSVATNSSASQASALSLAEPGALHLLSSATANVPLPLGSAGGIAAADSWMNDQFFIRSSTVADGTKGRITVAVNVEGTFLGNNSGVAGGNADWVAGVSVASQTASGGGIDNAAWAGRSNMNCYVDSGCGLTNQNSGFDSSFGQKLLSLDFVFGGLIDFTFTGTVDANASARDFSFARLTSNLSNTIGWGGILQVRDANGNAITNYSAISDSSGFNYANAYSSPVSSVPEPETYAMMVAGLGLLGFVGKRCRSEKGPAPGFQARPRAF